MKGSTAHMNRIMLALSAAGAVVWRNTTAMGWAGKSFPLSAGQVYRARGGERVILDAYPIRAGLCEGSGDIVGMRTVTVTPDMVGQKLAVFCSWEVKHGSGRPTKSQRHFADFVTAAGGIGAVVRSETEALATIKASRV